jgi:nitrite reductase/ring-hydroxylating ferredoxin subunit
MSDIIFEIPAASLRENETRAFEWPGGGEGGRKRKGFLAKLPGGTFAAYENECPHLGVPLDAGQGEFFEEEGRFFVCALHGALFMPKTGECIAGPCRGEALAPLALKLSDDTIRVLNEQPDE